MLWWKDVDLFLEFFVCNGEGGHRSQGTSKDHWNLFIVGSSAPHYDSLTTLINLHYLMSEIIKNGSSTRSSSVFSETKNIIEKKKITRKRKRLIFTSSRNFRGSVVIPFYADAAAVRYTRKNALNKLNHSHARRKTRIIKQRFYANSFSIEKNKN